VLVMLSWSFDTCYVQQKYSTVNLDINDYMYGRHRHLFLIFTFFYVKSLF